MINIAFRGGTHGNFLRYFLDRFSSLTPPILEDPFTDNGTSHKNIKYSEKFKRYHPNNHSPYFQNLDQQHIFITISDVDLLFLQRIVHRRAGDYKVDFTKEIIKFPLQYIENYNINSKFYELYNKVIDENVEIPEYICRDFFKFSFLNPSQDGFIIEQKKYIKELPKNTLFFPVHAFWDKDVFFKEINILDKKLDLQLEQGKESEDIFTTFQNKIEQLPTRFRCREVIECLRNKKNYDLSQIDIIEQAYLSSYIEQNYEFISVPNTNYFFQNTKEILDWIEWYPQHYKAMNPNLPTFNGIPNPFYLHKNGK
jgi:hypothetical protein